MIELQSISIRKKISLLCEFYENTLNCNELCFREGNREEHLKEIEDIKKQINSYDKFRLAFVGEYNSGKTSIINIITGRDLPVSSTVKTSESIEIDWNNVIIVDTPGLGSGLEEHDAITKEWLAKADLLVYVLTVDLLTEKAGERLHYMLDEYKRDNEIMIVVNMIDQEGNDISEYKEELQKYLNPKPLELYYPAFISAKYKEKSMRGGLDKEEAEFFNKKSHFDTFEDSVNDFILSRREKAALTTPLARLQALSWKISVNNKFDKECKLMDLKIESYENALKDIKMAFDDFISEVKDSSEGAAGNIFLSIDSASDIKEEIDDELKYYSEKVEISLKSFTTKLTEMLDYLQLKEKKIDESELGIEVYKSIEESDTLRKIFNIEIKNDQGHTKKAEYIADIKNNLNLMATNLQDQEIKDEVNDIVGSKNVIEMASKMAGKVNREIILKVGHSIGYKFKPWQAVKLASKFSKAVPFINIGAAAFETVMFIRKNKKEEDYKKSIREFKQNINDMMEKSVNETKEIVESQVVTPINDSIHSALQILKTKKFELLEFNERNKDLSNQIENKRNECMSIYDEIYTNLNR